MLFHAEKATNFLSCHKHIANNMKATFLLIFCFIIKFTETDLSLCASVQITQNCDQVKYEVKVDYESLITSWNS